MSAPDAPRLRLTIRLEDTDPLCEVCTLPIRIGDFTVCAVCGPTHKECKCEHRLEDIER